MKRRPFENVALKPDLRGRDGQGDEGDDEGDEDEYLQKEEEKD